MPKPNDKIEIPKQCETYDAHAQQLECARLAEEFRHEQRALEKFRTEPATGQSQFPLPVVTAATLPVSHLPFTNIPVTAALYKEHVDLGALGNLKSFTTRAGLGTIETREDNSLKESLGLTVTGSARF